jgi:hypothetical protein
MLLSFVLRFFSAVVPVRQEYPHRQGITKANKQAGVSKQGL